MTALHQRCSKCRTPYKTPRKAALCYYCDPAYQTEQAAIERSRERAAQIERDIAEGRRDGWNGRIKPRFED